MPLVIISDDRVVLEELDEMASERVSDRGGGVVMKIDGALSIMRGRGPPAKRRG